MVLPVDKGRTGIVMDTDTYRAKMSTLIENGPYQLLNKDLTDRLTRKSSEKLLFLKRSGYLSEAVYDKIKPDINSRLESTVYRRSIRSMYH